MPSSQPTQQFDKYKESGAYHYKSTIGASGIKTFDIRVAARYHTALELLKVTHGEKILDAGGGEGVAALCCARRGARATNLELDRTACELSKSLGTLEGFSETQFSVVNGSVYEMPFPDQSFDAVVSLEVIEHLQSVPRYLEEISRVLKPGGRFVVSTPHRRDDGKLQDPYHVLEFDDGSLLEAVSSVFPGAKVVSGWPYSIQEKYESARPLAVFGKIRRNAARLRAMKGHNIFAAPCDYDPRCPQLFCFGTKR